MCEFTIDFSPRHYCVANGLDLECFQSAVSTCCLHRDAAVWGENNKTEKRRVPLNAQQFQNNPPPKWNTVTWSHLHWKWPATSADLCGNRIRFKRLQQPISSAREMIPSVLWMNVNLLSCCPGYLEASSLTIQPYVLAASGCLAW